jgi:RecG-like helicase
MLRLLQGDVGSGKTLVALMALLTAVEAGRAGALLAPTEILARQHYDTLSRQLAGCPVNVRSSQGARRGGRGGDLDGPGGRARSTSSSAPTPSSSRRWL